MRTRFFGFFKLIINNINNFYHCGDQSYSMNMNYENKVEIAYGIVPKTLNKQIEATNSIIQNNKSENKIKINDKNMLELHLIVKKSVILQEIGERHT